MFRSGKRLKFICKSYDLGQPNQVCCYWQHRSFATTSVTLHPIRTSTKGGVSLWYRGGIMIYSNSTRIISNVWKKRNEHLNVEGAPIRSRNGAPSRKGRVVNGHTTKASNNWVRPPPVLRPQNISFLRTFFVLVATLLTIIYKIE